MVTIKTTKFNEWQRSTDSKNSRVDMDFKIHKAESFYPLDEKSRSNGKRPLAHCI